MAHVELPSGGWVEYRDKLMAADRFAVQDTVTLEFKDGGNRASLGMVNDQRNALLGRIIEKWSFPSPIPSQQNMVYADRVIGSVMDLDDYNVLAKAVQPLLDKISGMDAEDPKPQSDK